MNKQQKCGIIFIDHTKDPTYPLYLIVYSHKSRKYGFPKGTRETGESLTTCARREFYEETGYMLKDHIRFTIRYKIRNNTYFILNCYNDINTMIYKKSEEIPDKNEISYYEWVDKQKLSEIRSRCNLGLSSYINQVLLINTDESPTVKKKPRFLTLTE